MKFVYRQDPLAMSPARARIRASDTFQRLLTPMPIHARARPSEWEWDQTAWSREDKVTLLALVIAAAGCLVVWGLIERL